MKTIRHTVNVPGEMEPFLDKRIQDFRSLSGYFVSLGFTDMLYLPKRPIVLPALVSPSPLIALA